MRLHFAYGSNMDEVQMAHRCPESRPLGTAALPDHDFFITRNGWASVRPDDGATVWGLLWRISPSDEAGLDSWEDVSGGLYSKEVLKVFPGSGEPCNALVYVERSREPGTPEPWYIERIIASAARHRLPEDYQRRLRNWMR